MFFAKSLNLWLSAPVNCSSIKKSFTIKLPFFWIFCPSTLSVYSYSPESSEFKYNWYEESDNEKGSILFSFVFLLMMVNNSEDLVSNW